MRFPNAQTFWTQKLHHPSLQQSFLHFYLSENFKKILKPTPSKLPMSFTDNPIVWLMNEIPQMLSKTKMLKCFFKKFSTHCAAMYAAEKMLPLLPNKAISKHVWVELIHFQILYGHELITFSCLSHFIFNYLSASLAVMVHSLVQIRFICLNWWKFQKT